ncbi:hypothetical protein BN2475_1360003 [Paraburkholderia ribeironis]|uniref:Uncharacterized protein n=1 Tax=Paraburkholderia ribeironis TaxID=1247936 RepID=A0A1N7SPD8_9BURK|nr:hypothetical protein [Paraburkholderia ribeironis]SIT49309.1 hypothetical protein BN2475_1360003 [Paraburkholderia ribeironis]
MPQEDDVANTLDKMNSYFGQQTGVALDWEYLQRNLGISKPPGIPEVTIPVSNGGIKVDVPNARLIFSLSTEWGEGVLILYYGTLKTSGYEPPPEGEPIWRIYFEFCCLKNIPFSDIPAAGGLDPTAIGIDSIKIAINTADLSKDEYTTLSKYVKFDPPTPGE